MRLRPRGPSDQQIARKLIRNALVNINEDSIQGIASVTSLVNQGTGGAAFNLPTIVGTGANVKPHPSDSMVLFGASGDFASTPDSAAASITGDIDIRFNGALDDWTPAANSTLVSKYTSTGNQRSYLLQIVATTGVMRLIISTDGSATTTYNSTVAPTVSDGQSLRVRATLDIDNGASGSDATFYTSSDGETWSQLGDVVTTSVVSIFDSTTRVELGSWLGSQERLSGHIFQAQILNGIDGTLAVDFNAADYVNKLTDTTFVSSTTGETWTLNGDSYIQNTGKKVSHSIGGVGLESSAGQSILNPATVFVVSRVSDLSADRFMIDARSSSGNRFMVFSDVSVGGGTITMAQNSNLPATGSATTDPILITCQFNGGATSKITTSNGFTNTGNAGAQSWDYGTLFATFGGLLTMQGYIAQLVVIQGQLSKAKIKILNAHLKSEYNL